MDIVTLDVNSRDKSLKAKDLLNSNIIPAEFYGRGVKNQSVQMDYQTFRRVFRQTGSNTIIELKIDGKDSINVLVHEVQYNPVSDNIKHVDFINIRMGEKLKTHVPLEFTGVAPAVKEQDGILTPHLHEVEVECYPKDLIHKIEVSIESLVEFSDTVKVSDLIVPETIAILNNEDDVVITCIPPREEEEELPVVAEGEEGEEGVEGEEGAEGEEGEAAEGAEGEKGESKEGGKEEGGRKEEGGGKEKGK